MEAKLLRWVALFFILTAQVIPAYANDRTTGTIPPGKEPVVLLCSQPDEEERRIDSLVHLEAAKALLEQEFVLEGDELILRHGARGYVNSTINFVALHDGKVTVQISPFYSVSGLNGVGGITVEGNASHIKVEEDKKGHISLSVSVTGSAISAQIYVRLGNVYGRATATVSPNFNSLTTTLNGNLVPFSKSSVYKGNSL